VEAVFDWRSYIAEQKEGTITDDIS
jgi:hypothetical protein